MTYEFSVERLREALAGASLGMVARSAGIDRRRLYEYIRAEAPVTPSASRLGHIAAAVNRSPTWFYEKVSDG